MCVKRFAGFDFVGLGRRKSCRKTKVPITNVGKFCEKYLLLFYTLGESVFFGVGTFHRQDIS